MQCRIPFTRLVFKFQEQIKSSLSISSQPTSGRMHIAFLLMSLSVPMFPLLNIFVIILLKPSAFCYYLFLRSRFRIQIISSSFDHTELGLGIVTGIPWCSNMKYHIFGKGCPVLENRCIPCILLS
jgi:hypothetical protein